MGLQSKIEKKILCSRAAQVLVCSPAQILAVWTLPNPKAPTPGWPAAEVDGNHETIEQEPASAPYGHESQK
jgi:hypothetical protein